MRTCRYVFGTFVTWRILTLACAAVPAVFLIIMIFMPESPRHLFAKGRVPEAARALYWLRGVNSSEQVKDELHLVCTLAEISEQTRSNSMTPFEFSRADSKKYRGRSNSRSSPFLNFSVISNVKCPHSRRYFPRPHVVPTMEWKCKAAKHKI